jgi:hypothetical protein
MDKPPRLGNSVELRTVYSLANTRRKWYCAAMDEGRKRVVGIMAAILASMHMQTADDLFGGPQGSPRSDKLIAASVQWAEAIMRKIDKVFPGAEGPATISGIAAVRWAEQIMAEIDRRCPSKNERAPN